VKTHIELICKDGTIINNITVPKSLCDVKKDDVEHLLDDKVDLIIVTDCNKQDANRLNKICMSNHCEIQNYDVSTIKFIDISLTHNGNTHKIELKNDNHNFYVVNNKIDEVFLKYYLTNILKLDVNINANFQYELQLLDHEVNISLLNNEHAIIIEKNGYSIKDKCKTEKKDASANENQSQNKLILEEEQEEKSSQDDLSDDFEKIDKVDSDN
jgi:hypothetical protein